MRIRRAVLAAGSLALLVGGCGGGSGQTYNLTGSGSMTGTVLGQSMAVSDGISNVVSQGPAGSAGAILIGSAANQCSMINARQHLKNGSALAIVFGVQSGSTVAAPTVGDYTVHTLATISGFQGKVAEAQFVVDDASCNPTTSIEATTGTITVTRVDATGYTGTFNLTFGSDNVTGTFNTGTCSALGTVTSGFTCPP